MIIMQFGEQRLGCKQLFLSGGLDPGFLPVDRHC